MIINWQRRGTTVRSFSAGRGRSPPSGGAPGRSESGSAEAAAHARPCDGDLLVASESTASVRFTIRQLPAAVQFGATTREEAIRLARAFARVHAVDVWYRDAGAFRLLEAYPARTDGHRRTPARHRPHRPRPMTAQNPTTFSALLERIYGEFLEMPGLRLTARQAQRLWGLDEPSCRELLDFLVETRFLHCPRDGMYVRTSDQHRVGSPRTRTQAGAEPPRAKRA